jgi:chromosome segregation ATPase
MKSSAPAMEFAAGSVYIGAQRRHAAQHGEDYMDDETRAAFAETHRAIDQGFARVDRYFELAQAQHLELRVDLGRVEDGLGRVEDRLGRLEAEFRTFRDWVTAKFAELSRQIRDILLRLDRLERQQNGPIG